MYALEIENLTKVYANGFKALKGISLKVAEGDFFALLGPNGAGKSTTIGIVSSLVNKTSGVVKVLGHDMSKDLVLAKSFLGLVPQEVNFNQFETVWEIVINQAGYYGLPLSLAKIRAEKYLTQLGLWGKRKDVSRTLSGGMKRRLMIARALVHEPKVLILDEPTAGVDIELRRSMWDFLQTINQQQGITIILTTHYLEEAEYLCKGIAIIDKGEILEHATMKTLLSKLQLETLILDLSEPVSRLPEIESCDIVQVEEKTLEVTIPKTKSINEVFSKLTKAGIQVGSLRNKSNRLEELFLKLIQTNQQIN